MDLKSLKNGRKPKILALVFLSLFMMSLAGASVLATTNVSTVTVTKGDVPVAGAFVNVYLCEKQWYGLYYTTGDPVGTNITNANGQCTFTLDPAQLYQFQVNDKGQEFQVNSLGAASIAVSLGYVAEARGNAMPWIIGAIIAIIGLVFLGYIKFTEKGPFKIKV